MAATAIWKIEGNLGRVVNYAANLRSARRSCKDSGM